MKPGLYKTKLPLGDGQAVGKSAGWEAESAREGARANAILKIKRRAHGTDDTHAAVQPDALPEPIDGLNAGTMRAKNPRRLKFLPLVCRPIQLFLFGVEKMKSADRGLHRGGADELSGVAQRLMRPACPHPVSNTRPRGVLKTRD